MRCPRCANVQGANRSGMQCTQCDYVFVFSPKRGMQLTDRRVLAAAQRLGRGGAAFAPRQVLGALAARRRFLWWTRPVSSANFEAARAELTRLGHAHETTFAPMLRAPALEAAGTQLWPESDIYDYGAERIVVVDQPLAVDLLVHARVHVTAKAIVVDQHGYPARIAELARELVIARPDVPVMVFHGTGTDSATAIAAARRLVATTEPIVDVGLSGDAVSRHRALRWARRLPSVPLDALPRWMLGSALADALTSDRTLDAVLLLGDGGAQERSDEDYG